MYRKAGLIVLVCLTIFLFVGFAYAVCLKEVCVKQPKSGVMLQAGTVSNIVLEFSSSLPTNLILSKEKLEYICTDGPSGPITSSGLITIRSCSYTTCPTVYPWEVPLVSELQTDCQVIATILDQFGQKIFGAKSNGAFQIALGTLKVTQPNGGQELTSDLKYQIIWTSSMEGVAKSVLAYSCDGTTWNKIVALPGNPLYYNWTVPTVLVTTDTCKVKVTLRDGLNNVLATDKSDANFTIQPAPAPE